LNFKKRTSRLAEILSKKDSKIDFVLLTTSPNLKYYFNYPGFSFERFCCGLVSVATRKTALVLPKLDESKAASSSAENVFAWTDSQGYEDALNQALNSIEAKSNNIGCEGWITLYLMELVKKVKPRARFESIAEEIYNHRLIKDEEEIEAIRKSTSKLRKGYEILPEILKAGKTENDVAFEIRKTLTALGTSEVDFCGVQSGPNSAAPHSMTSQRTLSSGDMVVVDISCTDESGYYADFTRTYSIGKASNLQKNVYNVVKTAQSVGVQTARPNITAKVVDEKVRKVISKEGYAEYFVHRTGHGLGLEVHEGPWINDSNTSHLRSGMVFTIEPGIYLPDKFGIRIEDDIVLTPSGNENLTRVNHELEEI
jgi:Xaa-Pro aminopeptidase